MKNNKIIMIISLALNVIFIITIIVLLVGKNKNDSDISQPYEQDKIKQAVGVYQNNNWNGREALIILNDDKTCKTPSSSSALCNWNIENDKLLLYFSSYNLIYNGDEKDNPLHDTITFTTLEQCEEYKQRSTQYTDKLSCEFKKSTKPSEYIMTNSSIVYNNKVFTRVY